MQSQISSFSLWVIYASPFYHAKTVKLASAMELAQQGVNCVSDTGTRFKPDILKISTTKQHNKSNQHRKHSVSNNKPTNPCLDVLLRIIQHMSASIKHTCAYCKKVGHFSVKLFC